MQTERTVMNMRATNDGINRAKPFVIGAIFGAFMMAMVLEGRGAAILKAVTNPQGVNGVQFNTEVVLKK